MPLQVNDDGTTTDEVEGYIGSNVLVLKGETFTDAARVIMRNTVRSWKERSLRVFMHSADGRLGKDIVDSLKDNVEHFEFHGTMSSKITELFMEKLNQLPNLVSFTLSVTMIADIPLSFTWRTLRTVSVTHYLPRETAVVETWRKQCRKNLKNFLKMSVLAIRNTCVPFDLEKEIMGYVTSLR